MLFVIAGPSGAGKSYLISQLLQQFPGEFLSPQLITTRPVRAGNAEVDRQSVNPAQFTAMHAAGEFIVADQFRDHWYGFPATIAQPQAEHIVINTWPALVPQFAELAEVKLIGLTVAEQNFELLRSRMIQRGDTPEVVAERMKQVKIDLADLQKFKDIVNAKGKMFEIIGDSTIAEQVIPWVLHTAEERAAA